MEVRKIVILYGSQTGTAQDIAERIGREGRRVHFDTVVSSMDEFKVRSLPQERLIVFVASTTGQGHEPDNMRTFWKFLLRKNLPSDSLSSLNYGVIALGDSSYQKFNYAGKKLNKRLQQLGGNEIEPIALADDQHDLGPDFVVDSWLKRFWEKALLLYPIPEGLKPIDASETPPSKYNVKYLDNDESRTTPQHINYSKTLPHWGLIKNCTRVTSENHFQDTRLVDIETIAEKITYDPGDIIEILPQNLEENIEKFFTLFPNLNRNTKFILEPSHSSVALPSMFFDTVEECVRKYWDLQAIPKRYFFEILSHFTESELEKEKLMEFTTAEGQQELYDYCNRPRRNILEVLYDFRHTTPNIPFEYLFDLFPSIKPRSFSITSSPENENIQILVAVVKYKSKLVEPRMGLCSNWLARSSPNKTELPFSIKKGTLTFPKDKKTPILMVGPGTGIAPFRSYINHSINSDSHYGLFFGCRNSQNDYYFKDEWKNLEVKWSNNFQFFIAFSRDQPEKIYVQHLIERESEFVTNLIIHHPDSRFYVAGNAKQMPDQVRDALKKVLKDFGKIEDAERYVKTMELNGRFQTETWS